VYWVLAVIAAVMFVGSFLLKRNEPGKGGHVAVSLRELMPDAYTQARISKVVDQHAY
jgi:hypothetical protein